MRGKELLRYERLLIEKRRELQRATTSPGSLIPAAGHVEGDPVDKATAEAEANLQIQLHHADGQLLRAIDDALNRINHGTFGSCETCGKPIARARLVAVPWARHCLDCKERKHSAA